MKRKFHLLTLFVCLILAGQLSAQDMEVTDATTPPFTPENLITNIFLGDGVEVLNVTFSGDPISIGSFKNGLQEVGIDRGIIMTSGRASSSTLCNAAPYGANCLGNNFASTDNASMASDPDLTAIASGTIFDACKFSITFKPTSDTLRFKYVFASEEYPEWACSSFNDVFGFFISGPGINGTFQNNGINIAEIPGTNMPVTINNVHPQNGAGCPPSFSQFYNDNNGVSGQPVYDGYLSVFIAEAIVIPCETYTIKLMVSDVGDGVYDTGVFLEAKSFGTGSLNVETATVSLDGTITEGCASGSMTFSFPNQVETDFPLDYTIIGTAINGVDYQFVPLNLFIPAGDSSVTINFVGIQDLIDEGLESIGIDIQRDVCNRDTFWLFVRDNEILPPDLGPDALVCRGDTMALDGTLPIPLPVPPSFTNTNDYTITHTGPTYSPIVVAGVQPVTLGPGVIQSVCINITHKWADDLDLFLISPGGQFIELSTDNGSNCDNYNQVCFTPSATNPVTCCNPPTGCGANIETAFTNGTFAPEGVWTDLWDGEFPTNGTWQLLCLDDQQGFNGLLLDWTITFEPLYQLYYRWEPPTGLSCTDCPDPMANPDTTTTYILTAWDSYGCEVYDTITIEVNDVLPAPTINCGAVTDNSITYNWDPVPGALGYQVNINGAGWTVPNNGVMSHLVNGLTLSDTVTIQVFAIGNCDGDIGTAICNTPSCDAPALTVVSQTDVSCPSDTDGSVSVTASGGAGGYTFKIGTQTNTTGIFTGLPSGQATIVVTDQWNCPNSIQVTIGSPQPVVLQPVVINDISCKGDNDGSATVMVTGGVYPYSFNWNGNQTDSVATNLIPGQQSVTVTDANGCFDTLSLNIAEPDLLALNTAADSAACFGSNTGGVLVLIDGGIEPYIIQWDAAAGNSNSELVNNLTAGTYGVSVTDINGCQTTATATVLEPSELTTSASFQGLTCNSSGDGTATVLSSGGTPGYTFLWSNGQSAATSTGLDAGPYAVTVTDAKGCSSVELVNVTEPGPVEITLTTTPASCFGQSSGAVSSVVTGGTPPYSYSWNGASGGANLTNVPAGTYCLTVTGSNGCTAMECIDVIQPSLLTLSTSLTNAGCDGGTSGMVDLTVSGGTSPYTYLWNNSQTTQDISALPAGNYSVVTTDAKGCTATIAATLTDIDPIVLSGTSVPVKCKGGNDGSINLNANGGAGGFNYAWTGPGGYTSTQKNPATLLAGSYSVGVTDAAGCKATTSVSVAEPPTAVVATIAPPANICFQATNGTATVSVTGGSSPYTYLWSNGQTTSVINNLTAGTYTVTVTDNNGCKDIKQVAIIQQEQLSVSLSQTTASCYNGTDGIASIQSINQGAVNVPVNQVTVKWSAQNQTTPAVSNLTGGQTYSVTITNSLGCMATASITIGNPAEIGASLVSKQDVRCSAASDGTATVTGVGGTLPYSYLWSANAGGQTTATATGLPASDFTVTVTDAKGCSTTIQLSLSKPPALDLRFENKKVLCYGGADGASKVIAEGGVPPYSFVWPSGATGNQATGLAAGTFTVTVTDGNGCTYEETTEVLQPVVPLTATFKVDDVSCYGLKDGRIQVTVEGGTLPFTYSLDGTAFFGSSTLIALESGEYIVHVKDKNGCIFKSDFIFVEEPDPIVVNLGPDTTVIYNSYLEIEPTITGLGSNDTLTYSWYSNNPQTPVNFTWLQQGRFTVKSPTTATLTVTSKNGCTAKDLINIFVLEYRNIQVPTGFSPGLGGDPLNDLLHVHGSSFLVEKIKLFRIFDRWGELVYEAADFDINNTAVGWDGTFKGKDVPPGVYIWHMDVDFIDGSSESYKGHTTLIR